MNASGTVAAIGAASLLFIGVYLVLTDAPPDAEQSDRAAFETTMTDSGSEAARVSPPAFPPRIASRNAVTGAEVPAASPDTSATADEPAESVPQAPGADERACVFVTDEEWTHYLAAIRKATREGDWTLLLALPGDRLGSRLCDAEGRSFEPFAVTFPRMPRELVERLLAQGFMVAPRHLPRAAAAGKELLELFIGTGVSYEDPAVRDGMIRAFILQNDLDGLAYLSALGIDLSDPRGEKRWLDIALQLSPKVGEAEATMTVPEFLRRHGAARGSSEFEPASADAAPPDTGS